MRELKLKGKLNEISLEMHSPKKNYDDHQAHEVRSQGQIYIFIVIFASWSTLGPRVAGHHKNTSWTKDGEVVEIRIDIELRGGVGLMVYGYFWIETILRVVV